MTNNATPGVSGKMIFFMAVIAVAVVLTGIRVWFPAAPQCVQCPTSVAESDSVVVQPGDTVVITGGDSVMPAPGDSVMIVGGDAVLDDSVVVVGGDSAAVVYVRHRRRP